MSLDKTDSHRVILGIDPGYGRLGWAVVVVANSGWKTIKFGCIQTSKSTPLLDRYSQLEQALEKIIQANQPTEAAVETLFFSNNVKTAMQVAETRGIILACLLRHHIKITQYNPMQIKETVTGNGRADKKAVEKMVRLEFKLKPEKILDDAIDALAAVLTHRIRSQNLKYYA